MDREKRWMMRSSGPVNFLYREGDLSMNDLESVDGRWGSDAARAM